MEHTIEDPALRRLAIGNNLADLAAKEGLQAHPSVSDLDRRKLREQLKDLTAQCELKARVTADRTQEGLKANFGSQKRSLGRPEIAPRLRHGGSNHD